MNIFKFKRESSLREFFMSEVEEMPRRIQPYIQDKRIKNTGGSYLFESLHYYSPTMMLSNISLPNNKTLQIFYGSSFYFSKDNKRPFTVDVRIVDGEKVLEDTVQEFTIKNKYSVDVFCYKMSELMKLQMKDNEPMDAPLPGYLFHNK